MPKVEQGKRIRAETLQYPSAAMVRGVSCHRRAEEPVMETTLMQETLIAPEHLGLQSRTDFRQQAVSLLERLPEDTGRLVIDLGTTRQVDSAGLGALMLVQRKAAERRQTVVLRDANEELRFLLVLTKLEDLFTIESPGA
ncbi:MAG: STAS domain-containing protein [Gemmatimonadales bacterium]